jgi:hypothetical protein
MGQVRILRSFAALRMTELPYPCGGSSILKAWMPVSGISPSGVTQAPELWKSNSSRDAGSNLASQHPQRSRSGTAYNYRHPDAGRSPEGDRRRDYRRRSISLDRISSATKRSHV